MTMSITSLSQNQPVDQTQNTSTQKPIKLNQKTNNKNNHKSRLVSARRRPGVKKVEEDEEQLSSDSNSDHASTTSSLENSDDQDEDDDEDEDEDEDDGDNEDDEDNEDNDNQAQVKKDMTKSRGDDNNYDDQGQEFQVDHDDLESGVCRSPAPLPQLNGHSHQSDSEVIETRPTDEPSAHHLVQRQQPDTTSQTTALSTPTSSADSSTNPQLKQQPSPTAVSSQSHSTTIIFNQTSWVTGLSAALAATTNANNNSTSADDQPVQTPRYIPYIEFENYSTYGNLIFDLNTGLSRTARVDCKPDGLEKAPPEALEEQFVRITPSRDQPSNTSSQPSMMMAADDKDHCTSSHAQGSNDTDNNSNLAQEADRTIRRGKKLGSFSEKNKKKKKKKKKEFSTRTSLDAHVEPSNEQSSDQPLKIKIIPPQPTSTNNQPPIEASSTSTSSHFNRPPSSLAGGILTNRPPSAFSCAAQSEDNRSASASEAHSLEPWAIPRSGRFWGHDDRQSYHHRRGGRGFLAKQTGNASSTSRGTLRNRGGFRADWPTNSPSSRKSQSSTRRPETPAGQSDTGRSAASAGWITVPSKQKPFLNGFQHQQFNSSQKSQAADQADNGEWRHDGWEEIEREADRKLHSSNRGRGGYNQSRGTAGWRSGAQSSSQLRRPTTNLTTTSESPSAHGKADVGPAKSSSTASASTSTPHGKESDQVPSSTPTKEVSSTNTRDRKLVNGDHHVLEAAEKTKSPPIVETITRSNPSPSLSRSATPSSQPKPVLVQLPKAIKIGTIPVYPPVSLQSQANEKTEMAVRSQPTSSPVDHSSSHVPSTPDLSDTLQVSRSASTLEDHPSQKSDPIFTPLSATEPASGPITLGSAGGAEVLREAMSTPKVLMPSYPPPPQDVMVPISHPTRSANSQQHGSHSRTSSLNSRAMPPSSFGQLQQPNHNHHHHHHHPDFAEQALRQPPPPHNFQPAHPPHLGSSASYHHNSIPALPPPPPHSTINQPGVNFYHQPSLGPIPPLQYFDSHNHNVIYPHPPSFGPLPTSHVYPGAYLPPPPPQQQQQQQHMGPSRAHPPIFHPLPPQPAFEPSPPPALPPPPPHPPTSPGMPASLPGHFAPPKSTKVRISHPGRSDSSPGGDNSFFIGTNPSAKPSFSDPHLLPNSSENAEVKTTDTGISYYEFNGVTYFGDSRPPLLGHHPPSSTGRLHPDDDHSTPPHNHHDHHHYQLQQQQQQQQQMMMMMMGPGLSELPPAPPDYPLYPPPPQHLPPHHHHPHPHHHHPLNTPHHPHMFTFTGHHGSATNDDFLSATSSPPTPATNLSISNPIPIGNGTGGGQVVLSQVIRPPLGIPFG